MVCTVVYGDAIRESRNYDKGGDFQTEKTDIWTTRTTVVAIAVSVFEPLFVFGGLWFVVWRRGTKKLFLRTFFGFFTIMFLLMWIPVATREE